MIEETCKRAQTAFREAIRRIEEEESARPRPSRKPSASAHVDVVIATMERATGELRASARRPGQGQLTSPAAWRPDAARETIQQLEGNLKALAEARDAEAAHASEWERRATLAVKAKNDELALEALRRKREHDRVHRLFAREHEYGIRVVGLLRELFDAVEERARVHAESDAPGRNGEK